MSVRRAVEEIIPFIRHNENEQSNDKDGLSNNATSQIRNVAVIAHVDHGKSTLVNALCVAKKLCKGNELFMDSLDAEAERGITIKSSSISFVFDVPMPEQLRRNTIAASIQGSSPSTSSSDDDSKKMVKKQDTKEDEAKKSGSEKCDSQAKTMKKPQKKKKQKKSSRFDRNAPLQWHHTPRDTTMPTEKVLLNVIDSPGHVDFSSEVTAALRLADGALVVIDCAEGPRVQTRTVVRQALAERIRPVLFVNKLDKMFFLWPGDYEACYQRILRGIESLNAVIQQNDPKLMGPVTVHPQNATVAFGSGLHGWGFTLRHWAAIYHNRCGISERKMMKKLWGDNFWDPKTKLWSRAKTLQRQVRGFNHFVLRPLNNLFKACKDYEKHLERQDVVVSSSEEGKGGGGGDIGKWMRRLGVSPNSAGLKNKKGDRLVGSRLFGALMKGWMPAAEPMVKMIHQHVPSPLQAQKYRSEILYAGPQDDAASRAMRACDPEGPLMVYISKMLPAGGSSSSSSSSRFLAFGRVFSGTMKSGEQVRILGDDYYPGAKHGLFVKPVSSINHVMGPYVEAISGRVGPGAVVAIAGIDRYLEKNATLTTAKDAHTFVSLHHAVAPVVRVLVHLDKRAARGAAGDRLPKALRQLSQADPLIKVIKSEEVAGGFILCVGGILHLDVSLNDLREKLGPSLADALIVSQPTVSFRETIASESRETAVAKSANKHNRIHATAAPMDKGLLEAVCAPESKSDLSDFSISSDAKKRARALVSEFSFDPATAKKVWALHHNQQLSSCNMLVDGSRGSQYANEIKEMVLDGFAEACAKGILCQEPLTGLQMTVEDFKIIADSAHRNARQITPMARQCVHTAQLLSDSRLLEPYFELTLTGPKSAEKGIFTTLRQTHGQVVDQKGACSAGDFVEIAAHLSVRNSFGFTKKLRENTKGEAFVEMKFSHWDAVPGDPRDKQSEAGRVVLQIRKRKGLKPDIPHESDYQVRL
mmetsp:Transcript_26811/g.43084  ORF Transcript_26811/g.43084 Transcript_26811/m.43084 type:complete len:983 (+) Transcript_26811:424-3372(+)